MQRDHVSAGESPASKIWTNFDEEGTRSMIKKRPHWWIVLLPFTPNPWKLNVSQITLAATVILSSMASAFAQADMPTNTAEHQTIPITGYRERDVDPCSGLLDAQGCISGKEFLNSQWNRGSGTITRGHFLYSKPPGETNTPDSDCKISPKSNRPVIIATGEKTLSETDFKDHSLAGLSMERTYRSNGESHLFGPGWKSQYAYTQLSVSPQCSPIFGYSWTGCLPIWIRAKTNDGIELTFYRASNLPMYFLNGQSNNNTYGHINAFTTGVWTWAFRDRVYRYKSYTRSLESIDENGSRLLTFTYDLYGALLRIQSRTGRSINFAWAGNRVTSIIDPTGGAWKYSYDAVGMLSSVSPPGNAPSTRTYHYEPGTARLTGYSVDGVRKTRYMYDSSGRVTWSGLDNGEEFDAFEYGTNYTIKRDHLGQAIRYNFESSGSLKRLVGVNRESTSTCAPTSMAQTYDAASGRLATSTDFRGVKTVYSYTGDGLLLSVVAAANTQESATLTNVWNVDRVVRTDYIGSNGTAYRRVEFTYGAGRSNYWPVSKTETDLLSGAIRSSTMSYTFHDNGILKTRTLSWSLSGSTQATEIENFDSFGNLLNEINAAGHVTSYSGHDQLGRPARKSDPSGLITLFTYDSKGRVTSLISSSIDGSLTTTFNYNGEGQVTQTEMSNGWKKTASYNSGGRLISIDGGSQNYSLDQGSRTTTVTTKREVPILSGSAPYPIVAGEFKKALALDSLGRPKYRIGALGQSTTESYDGEGNVLTRSDPAGRVTSMTYDA